MATHDSLPKDSTLGKHSPESPSTDQDPAPLSTTVQPAVRLPSLASAAKFADWGIYNYKAVVAYDGTAYKYAIKAEPLNQSVCLSCLV